MMRDKKMRKTVIKTKQEARQKAIEWQEWRPAQDLSYAEFAEWQGYFKYIADKFGLTNEFKENGII